jgi:hypothetical protein
VSVGSVPRCKGLRPKTSFVCREASGDTIRCFGCPRFSRGRQDPHRCFRCSCSLGFFRFLLLWLIRRIFEGRTQCATYIQGIWNSNILFLLQRRTFLRPLLRSGSLVRRGATFLGHRHAEAATRIKNLGRLATTRKTCSLLNSFQ